MVNRRPDKGLERRRARGAIVERLFSNLLDYSQDLLTRIGLQNATISAQLDHGQVVTVCHCASAVFPLQSARKRSEATAAPVYDVSQRRLRLRSLSPAAINAMLGLRLNRLLRDFEIGFGAAYSSW